MLIGNADFDAVVVGSGPAGAVAALVLARGGAKVALVDKAGFPRDKACGDLIGPRGVAVLDDLALRPPGSLECADMIVVGPTGRRVRLPCLAGTTYPATVLAVPRMRFDAWLREAALESGAEYVRATVKRLDDGALVTAEGHRIDAPFVVGADGAHTVVGTSAGLVDAPSTLRAFAVRGYVDANVTEPHIVFWDSGPRCAFPGYGWIFPGPGGVANVGLGAGATASARPAREIDAFLTYLGDVGLVEAGTRPERITGGWLTMASAGTIPAAGRVLLAGDAAGLVNPLQGEGIAEALASGRAAAEAILGGGEAAERYRAWVSQTYARFQSAAAVVHRFFLPRPRATSMLGRTLVGAARVPAVAAAWSVYWNDLLDGAAPGSARTLAALALRSSSLLTRNRRLMSSGGPGGW